MSLDFCAIDFETANGKRGSVCSVGMVRVRGGVITERTGGLIRPPAGLDHFAPANVAVHGLSPSSVIGAPGWPQALNHLMQFLRDDLLVAHNASFEASVLEQASQAEHLIVPSVRLVCSLGLARQTHRDLPRHRLPDVARACGVSMGNHHDAADDAEASALVTVAMARKVGASDLPTLVSMTGQRVRVLG